MPELERERVDSTRDVLDNAASRSLKALNLDARWHDLPHTQRDAQVVDGHLEVRWAGGEHEFYAHVKRTVRPSLITLAGPPPSNTILITDHVTDGMAKALQQTGWAGYVDAAGNASLAAPGLAVRVTGKTPRGEKPRHTAVAFSRTGLPVTFGILVAHLTGVVWTQRELAQLTETSLGSVNRVIRGLRGRYLNDDGKVTRQQPLVDAWTAAYIETQPTMWPSKHYVSDKWTDVRHLTSKDLPTGCLFSSELAAHHQGAPIRPATALVYCPTDRRTELIKVGRLRHDPRGSIAVRPTFWSPAMLPDVTEAPRFLIRADLLLEDDPRLEDLARELRL